MDIAVVRINYVEDVLVEGERFKLREKQPGERQKKTQALFEFSTEAWL